MDILHVRFGDLPATATSAASALIDEAADGTFRRRTPGGELIWNNNYEGDWDAEIQTELAFTVAHWVVRVWPLSSIEEDEIEEDEIEEDSIEEDE
jgi:hypothetical protein